MLRQRLLPILLILLVCAGPIAAQTAPATKPAPNTAAVQAKDPIDVKLQEALRERDAIIRNLLERVSELEWRLNGGFTSPAKVDEKPVLTAASSSRVINSVVSTSTYDNTERQATEALDQALIVRGGLLLPSGTLEIDNTTSYLSASADHVTVDGFALLPVLVVGDITSERVREDYLLPAFTARLGLPHKFQGDFQIPYGYELIRTVDAENVQTSSSSFGLGDISFGLSRQFVTEHGKWPDMLANVRFKTTTGKDPYNLASSQVALGTGFPGLQGNLTMAKSSDPVVFFGNLNYTANLPANHTVPANDPTNPQATMVGHFNPGSSVGFQIGSILALNPETSMTVSWDQRFTRSTQLNGVDIPASYLVEGTLRLGTSYLYAPGRTIDLSFGVGLTPDTPNLQFSVGLPFRLGLWGPKQKKLER
ncbi:transporter [Tunturiibacter lichenicola]|uniref:transporter n=1 Tax=Tunturiibacter lichenicola TaxID=2051959 RepID=UPI0021B4049F|nr:transporter [Edaphobacter lichenicola]